MNKSSFIKMAVSTLSILLAISLYLQSGLTLSTVHAQDAAVDSDYESYTSQIESYSSLIRYAEYAQLECQQKTGQKKALRFGIQKKVMWKQIEQVKDSLNCHEYGRYYTN